MSKKLVRNTVIYKTSLNFLLNNKDPLHSRDSQSAKGKRIAVTSIKIKTKF